MKPKNMLSFILTLIAGLAFAPAVIADFHDGKSAFFRSDYTAALAELEPLAKDGDADAQYLLGVMCAHGAGVTRDDDMAADWYRQAALQGLPEAQFSLGFLLYGKGASDEGAYFEAARWLLEAAKAGFPMAQYLIGRMYTEGQGLPKDADEGLRWTISAAEGGNAAAQYEVGIVFGACLGTRCDRTEAYKWFSILAGKGYPGAAQNTARLSAVMDAQTIGEAINRADNWRPRG